MSLSQFVTKTEETGAPKKDRHWTSLSLKVTFSTIERHAMWRNTKSGRSMDSSNVFRKFHPESYEKTWTDNQVYETNLKYTSWLSPIVDIYLFTVEKADSVKMFEDGVRDVPKLPQDCHAHDVPELLLVLGSLLCLGPPLAAAAELEREGGGGDEGDQHPLLQPQLLPERTEPHHPFPNAVHRAFSITPFPSTSCWTILTSRLEQSSEFYICAFSPLLIGIKVKMLVTVLLRKR